MIDRKVSPANLAAPLTRRKLEDKFGYALPQFSHPNRRIA
jgi:hypothetical protein